MGKKRKIGIILLVAMLAAAFTGLAGQPPEFLDFSGSQDGQVPVGFQAKAFGLGSPSPELTAPAGVYGKDGTDISSKLTSGSGVSKARNPYVIKNINYDLAEGQSAVIGVRLAAEDKNSNKAASVAFNGASAAKATPLVSLSADGSVYGLEQKIKAVYETGRWYRFDIVFTGGSDKCDIYMDGILATEGAGLPAAVGSLSYFTYGISGKVSDEASAALYADDYAMYYEDASALLSTKAASGVCVIDNEKMEISDIPSWVDASSFAAQLLLPAGAAVSLADKEGNPVTSGPLYSGLRVCVQSANGLNHAVYIINNMKASLAEPSAGQILRQGVETAFAVEIAGAEEIQRIELYINGNLAQTLLQAPYRGTFSVAEEGNVEVYAVVYGAGGGSVKTQTAVCRCERNQAPVIAWNNMEDGGEIAYGQEAMFSVIASDADGSVSDVALFLDKNSYSGIWLEDAYVFSVSGITMGTHTIYAQATDNEGLTAKTPPYTITCTKKDIAVLDDFNVDSGATKWWKLNLDKNATLNYTETTAKVREDFGKSYAITLHEKSEDNKLFWATEWNNGPQLAEGDITFSMDFMYDNPKMFLEMVTLRAETESIWNTEGTLENEIYTGKDGYRVQTLEVKAGEWHRLEYHINVPKRKSSLYIDGVLLNRSDSVNTNGTVGDLRMFIRSHDIGDATLYMDNLLLTKAIPYPYVEQVDYLMADGSGAGSGGSAAYGVAGAKLKFNTALAEKNFEVGKAEENVSLYCGGVKLEGYSVTYDAKENSVLLSFGEQLKSQTEYEIKVKKDITTSAGKYTLSDTSIYFTVGPKPFDAVNWKTVRYGTGEIKDTSMLKKGDKVKVSAEFVNTTGETKKAVLVSCVYSGNRLLGYAIKEISIRSSEAAVTPAASEYITLEEQPSGAVTVEAYIWQDLNLGNSEMNPYILK